MLYSYWNQVYNGYFFSPALFLQFLKEFFFIPGLTMRSPPEDEPPDPQQLRLDKMLESEVSSVGLVCHKNWISSCLGIHGLSAKWLVPRPRPC